MNSASYFMRLGPAKTTTTTNDCLPVTPGNIPQIDAPAAGMYSLPFKMCRSFSTSDQLHSPPLQKEHPGNHDKHVPVTISLIKTLASQAGDVLVQSRTNPCC